MNKASEVKINKSAFFISISSAVGGKKTIGKFKQKEYHSWKFRNPLLQKSFLILAVSRIPLKM